MLLRLLAGARPHDLVLLCVPLGACSLLRQCVGCAIGSHLLPSACVLEWTAAAESHVEWLRVLQVHWHGARDSAWQRSGLHPTTLASFAVVWPATAEHMRCC